MQSFFRDSLSLVLCSSSSLCLSTALVLHCWMLEKSSLIARQMRSIPSRKERFSMQTSANFKLAETVNSAISGLTLSEKDNNIFFIFLCVITQIRWGVLRIMNNVLTNSIVCFHQTYVIQTANLKHVLISYVPGNCQCSVKFLQA